MPLTAKGEEILKQMQQEYGEEKGKEVFYASKNAGTITGVDSAEKSSLNYFGSRISPNQLETREGYLIALNVPICRTGYQEYLGSELENHPDFDESWGIQPDDVVKVYRPLAEVTSPATIASFEGKSVVDEHPTPTEAPNGLVTIDNESGLNRGHAQHVRAGGMFQDGENAGETPLLADLHIKSSDLIQKVEGGIRDVSCGYTYRLKRSADGTLMQTDIRGNHVAVVSKGRAGREVSIRDSAPSEIKPKGGPTMKILDHIFGRGLKDYAKDASPEELAKAMKEIGVHDAEPETEEEKAAKKKKADEEKAEHDRKAAHDAEIVDLKSKIATLEAALDAAKKTGKDGEGEEKLEELESHDSESEEEKKKREEEEKKAHDEAGVIEEIDEKGKAALKTSMDASRALLKSMKPVAARIANTPKAKRSAEDQAALDSYNSQVRALNGMKGVDAYKAFVAVKGPDEVIGDSLGVKGKDLKSPAEFFAGKTHKQGMADWNAYLATVKEAK